MGVLIRIGAFAPLVLFATTFTWNDSATNWNAASSWTPSGIPSTTGDTAIFSKDSLTNQPALTANITIGSLELKVTDGVTLSGTDTLTFGGATSITVENPANEISAPISLTNSLSVSLSINSSFLTLSGGIAATSNSLSVTGVGTLVLDGTNSYSGGTSVDMATLQVKTNASLGSGDVTLTGGILRSSDLVSLSQNMSLSGTSKFDVTGNTLTLSGVISGDALTKIGNGTLSLSGENKYTGGTDVLAGTLKISEDSNLGSGTLTLGAATLNAGASFSLDSSRSIELTGDATISLGGNTLTVGGNITGSGSLAVSSGGTLVITGTNSYSGGTTVNSATLQGTTESLQGAISPAAGSVIFDQATSGTYAGTFNGSGGTTLTLRGGGTYTFSGDSSSSSSATSLESATLTLTGSLGAASFTVDAFSVLSGTGTLISDVTPSGKISPGIGGEGSLTITGDVDFSSGTFLAKVDPTAAGLLSVSGTATLTGGYLEIDPSDSGFYGLEKTYTILTAGTRDGEFSSKSVTDSRFSPTVNYVENSVILTLANQTPFLGFAFANANERAVGMNLDALSLQGLLNDDLTFVINSLTDQSVAEVNRALDQMHPAALGAYAELQTHLGSQMLFSFSKRPSVRCGCWQPNRVWVEPFGNWLDVDSRNENLGFKATTKGVTFGYDREFFDFWTVGFGAAYGSTDLDWSRDQGYAYLKGAYGALYTDFALGNFALSSSFYAGKDWYHTMRHIQFTVIDRQATTSSSGLDLGSSLRLAYFFGNPSFLLYPYLELDYLYLANSSFSERGAESLSLDVDSYKSSTLVGQTGLTMRFVDRNYDDTVCVSPLLSIGYFVEAPLYRSSYQSRFSGKPIPFKTKGWDTVWQLLDIRLGLGITYTCFTLDALYVVDVSPDGGSPYTNQRADFRFSYQF